MVQAARRRQSKYDECEGTRRRHQEHSVGGCEVLRRLNSVLINANASLYVNIELI